ncbi:unnamed protein product [Adineta steineri]|uniref:B box-type domain-containing protein n=1 Tax=Adineta steineri TaxID=433720 RepID=A0A815X1I9_9BILA|nr:unnamed protein product [Adineta steineri]CAF1553467.1 unnamed protein product [Adineta steineri]
MATNDIYNEICFECGEFSGEPFICNQCHQTFCSVHIEDHQEDIPEQMQTPVQNHELPNQDKNDDSYNRQLFHRIDQWEKESVDKIKVAAELARVDLRLLIEKSTNYYKESTKKVSQAIDRSQRLNTFPEVEINTWIQQLNEIQRQSQTSFYTTIKEDRLISPIYMIKVTQEPKTQTYPSEQSGKRSRNTTISNLKPAVVNDPSDRFDEVFGEANLDEKKLVVIGDSYSRSCVSGVNLYSNGKHSVEFGVEEIYTANWSCFFGIITSNERLSDNIPNMKSLHGFWSSGYHVICGERLGVTGARRWYKNHKIILTFDCDNGQFQIENKRTAWRHKFDIDPRACPFPWKFICFIKGCQLRIQN